MQNDKLLSCPFCGVESARTITKERLFLGQNEFAVKKIDVVGYVKCNKCHARGSTVSAILYKNTKNYFDDIAKLKEEAIKTWNTREPMGKIASNVQQIIYDSCCGDEYKYASKEVEKIFNEVYVEGGE